MRSQKLNALLKLAEVKDCGLLLCLKKGLNELLHLRLKAPRISDVEPIPGGDYKEGKISVIICTYNRNALAVDTAKSILSQSASYDDYEIIVVDNNPGKSSVKKEIEKLWHKSGAYMGYVREKRSGVSYARNTGAKHASGEYLLFLDDDTVADRYLLSAMINAFKRKKSAGIIGGIIEIALPTPTPKLYNKDWENIWSGYTAAKKTFYTVKSQYELPYGACLGVRHSVFDALGGFPSDYGRCGDDFAGGEDTAFCLRGIKQGVLIGIEPKAQVMHNIDTERFSPENIQRTVSAGIATTIKLSKDGYIRTNWTHKYIRTRIKIAEREIKRLKKTGAEEARIFKKECERAALAEGLEC